MPINKPLLSLFVTFSQERGKHILDDENEDKNNNDIILLLLIQHTKIRRKEGAYLLA